MREVIGYPPMYDEIAAKFGLRGARGVIFAWGDRIFNPHGGVLTPSLRAHENVHGERQSGDVAGWWRRYLDDPAFRLGEEILAHRAEYRQILTECNNRQQRRVALKPIAKRLASPMYGGMTTLANARRAILEAI